MKTGGEVIIVAVDAGKEITDYAIDWALRNVSRALDSLVLLALLPSHGSEATASPASIRGQQSLHGLVKKWVMKKWYREENPGMQDSLMQAVQQEEARRINKVCLDMIRHLCRVHKKQLQIQVKVIADAQFGSVASSARELEATWVVLDRRLKKEGDCCMRQLKCNIVVMEHSVPKVMRTAVNPNRTRRRHSMCGDQIDPAACNNMIMGLPCGGCNLTASTSTATTLTSFGRDSDAFTSVGSLESPEETFAGKKKPSESHGALLHLNSELVQKEVEVQVALSKSPQKDKPQELCSSDVLSSKLRASNGKIKSHSGLLNPQKVLEKVESIDGARRVKAPMRRSFDGPVIVRYPESLKPIKQGITRRNSLTNSIRGEEMQQHPEVRVDGPSNIEERTSSIRRAISITIKPPPIPPPLCSTCKHKAPIFGKAPKKFTYEDIRAATDGFSRDNIVAQGDHGSVYTGKLPDGQAVAVKQYKALTAQSASEFCSEVEVLSCAQHRNLVMLLGYCIETEWLLVYELACNGSLDHHLYGKEEVEDEDVMAWEHRMKVAIGAARGLRYLHEDCRVGCIVHRDFRPQNILLTHDYEPMVGDFGLARWQSDGQKAEETRVIGAIGYLAPEYTQAGLITEKADVYAFGMVLLELLCGVKAPEFSRNMGQQFLLELVKHLGRWLLDREVVSEILDPRLNDSYVEKEVRSMIYASSLCLSPNPEKRPRMSKVLKILEGDIPSHPEPVNVIVQPPTVYPNQFVNMIYGSETPVFSRALNQASSFKKAPHWRRHSTIAGNENQGRLGTPSAGRAEDFRQAEMDFSGEYRAHLEGSLAKFFEGLNRHGKTASDEPAVV
ncbi:unnamed protein product [Linum tenue]|uniref:Protein kinase domain-containing protein n=1 Tax=Linum tenue TaxID=586396 RepID=A0AAV0RTS1_9ROSI|nr:unnamed protein product [Linum tenue]